MQILQIILIVSGLATGIAAIISGLFVAVARKKTDNTHYEGRNYASSYVDTDKFNAELSNKTK